MEGGGDTRNTVHAIFSSNKWVIYIDRQACAFKRALNKIDI
jgi:hypothetical protein